MSLGISGASNYRFSNEARPTFANTYHAAAKDPIGVKINSKNIAEKAASLASVLDGVDLRNISSQELANLGGALYEAGEISDNSIINFVVGNSNLASRDTRFDAIAYFENGLQLTKNDSGMRSSGWLYQDVLNTLYNVDKVIKNVAGTTITTKA